MTMTEPTRQNLNSLVEFDRPFTIQDDGSMVTADCWGPEVYSFNDDNGTYHAEIDGNGWTFVDGFSGQYLYSGPVMHPSECLGGAMAEHVLENPGTYVVVSVFNLEDYESADGWALLVRNGEH